jgi:hypothetical protein
MRPDRLAPPRRAWARWPVLVVVLSGVWGAAFAGPTPAPVRAEIDAMLNRLETSGCQFLRNGSWHDGARAKAHLLDKLAYIEKRGTVQSAEQFIELAASRSSLSGRPYQVRCGGQAPVESRRWLGEQLTALRGASGGTRP